MLMICLIGMGNVHKYLSTDRERRPDIISTTYINVSYSREISVFDA